MKTKDYLLYLISSILNIITFTLCSLIFFARKLPVFFAISIICALCTMLMLYLCIKEIRTRDSDFIQMSNTNIISESVQKGTLYRYGFDRHDKANKICAVLKYLSLTHPNLQMPELRGIFEQKFAANLLTEIILNSCWYKDSVTIKSELSFFSKDDYTYTFSKFLTLYDELSEYIKKANVHLTIESFSSNYDGGYYGEIYDNAQYK